MQGIGIMICLFGAVTIFAKGLTWEINSFLNELRGLQPAKRTSLWDTGQNVLGVFLIVLGIWAIYAGYQETQRQQEIYDRYLQWPIATMTATPPHGEDESP